MTARLTALILCDFAQVREGLLFVQSGGLTRLVAQELPAKFNCSVAALVYVPPIETSAPHRMVIKLKAADTARLVATINVAMHELPEPPGLRPGEGRLVPIVVPIHSVTFSEAGQYDLHVDIDDELAGDLTFWVERRGAAGRA